MIKKFCDLCGEEIKQREYSSHYKIKELKRPRMFEDVRWVDLIAHDKCIEELLKKCKEIRDGE